MDRPENVTIDPEVWDQPGIEGVTPAAIRTAAIQQPKRRAPDFGDGEGESYEIRADGLILWVRIGIDGRRVTLARRDA